MAKKGTGRSAAAAQSDTKAGSKDGSNGATDGPALAHAASTKTCT